MPSPQDQAAIRVKLTPDGSQAVLVVPASLDRQLLSEELCHQALQEAGVEYTREVAAAVRDVLKLCATSTQDVEACVAKASAAVDGVAGRIEWLIDESAGGDDCEDKSFYERSPYVMVRSGQVIGRLIAPTAGQDGRDVKGKTIAAKAGRAVALKLDASILRNSRDELIAQTDGLLVRTADAARISQLLEIPGFVDFSTGNVRFDGDVSVKEGIRDLFVVQAKGSVEVRGLIESATIECGHDLVAYRGMAGREGGHVKVGGHLIARYLNNVQGEVHGDLRVEREVLNCGLSVDGSVRVPNGSVIGGRIICGGAAEIGTLGSSAAATTELVVERLPRLEQVLDQLAQVVTQLTHRRSELVAEQQRLTSQSSRPSAAVKERLTELLFEIQQAEAALLKAQTGRESLAATIAAKRCVAVTVYRELFEGAVLTLRDRQFKVHKSCRGPLRITRGDCGSLWCRVGDAPGFGMEQIAHVHLLSAPPVRGAA